MSKNQRLSALPPRLSELSYLTAIHVFDCSRALTNSESVRPVSALLVKNRPSDYSDQKNRKPMSHDFDVVIERKIENEVITAGNIRRDML